MIIVPRAPLAFATVAIQADFDTDSVTNGKLDWQAVDECGVRPELPCMIVSGIIKFDGSAWDALSPVGKPWSETTDRLRTTDSKPKMLMLAWVIVGGLFRE